MTLDQLPEHWRERLSAGRLGAEAFPLEGVRLRFEDGSEVHFRYAFFIEDASRNELAVFTEHCGHHVFPLRALEAWESSPAR